jgi:hypothetical protein
VQDPDGALGTIESDAEIAAIHYPRVARLVKSATGADRVFVFDHTRRSSARRERGADGVDTAVDEAHNDYTPASGSRRVKEVLAERCAQSEAQSLQARRHAIINVWRSTNARVEQMPLALCDRTTLTRDAVVAAELRWRHRTGEVCAIRHRAEQRWYYFPRMLDSEALLFVCHDSAAARDSRNPELGFGAHTGFIDPSAEIDARPRQSIELRCVVVFAC